MHYINTGAKMYIGWASEDNKETVFCYYSRPKDAWHISEDFPEVLTLLKTGSFKRHAKVLLQGKEDKSWYLERVSIWKK
jgi:hypothetical protein